MKKWGIALIAFGLLLGSCKRDDDFDDLPLDEQNQVDDTTIERYLEDHYFEPTRGLIKKYDADNEEDDQYPSLRSLGVKLPSGVWVVKRPGVEAEGPAIQNNLSDSILISFNSTRFKATFNDLAEGEQPYEKFSGAFYNTIFSTGTAAWDPIFYYSKITEDQANTGITQEHFVVEGFVEGLKEFKSTMTNGADLYNFQGAIIVPSRMAYGRDFVYFSGIPDQNSYRDNSFVFNFELHRVVPRNNQ